MKRRLVSKVFPKLLRILLVWSRRQILWRQTVSRNLCLHSPPTSWASSPEL